MTVIALKEKLHGYIDHADEKKLTAIYNFIEDGMEEPRYVYDDETINILEERREQYIKGDTRGFTVKESMEHVKKN